MQFDSIDKVLSALKDWHIPCAMSIFGVGSVLQWCHHLDSSFVAFTGVVLAAITGHAFSPAQKDQK